jgi:glycosyltransferase involved in cell wall biosynthesis
VRIIHILPTVRRTGNGIVNVGIDLACLQSRDGHDVVVASGGGEFEALLRDYGVQHVRLDQRRRPGPLLRAVAGYRMLVRDFRPDIVHAHVMTGVLLARAFAGRTPYITIATVHNEFRRDAILMGLADRVIAVSSAVADAMRRRGVPRRKISVVRNGTLDSPRTVSLDRVEPAQLQHPAIVTVAGMYHRKGIAELLNAFERIAPAFPLAHLYLVGEGPQRREFERVAALSAISERIHFERFQAQPQRYLRAADVFVLASRRDPSPLVLPEAREAGCAIVATAVDGIPEALDYGEAGMLVPLDGGETLAAAIAALLGDADRLARYRARSRSNIGWLSVDRVHAETLAVYAGALTDVALAKSAGARPLSTRIG